MRVTFLVLLLMLVQHAEAQMDNYDSQTTLVDELDATSTEAWLQTTEPIGAACTADDGAPCLCPDGLFRVRNTLPLLTQPHALALPALAAVDVPHVRCDV